MEKRYEQKMRKALSERRNKLVGTDDEIVKDAQGLRDDDVVDEVDRAQTAQAGEVIARLDGKDQRELGEIDAALERLAEGRYGICAECEEEIPQARLEVLPEARACAGCAEPEERRQNGADAHRALIDDGNR
jgi:DnaK suppressor protein